MAGSLLRKDTLLYNIIDPNIGESVMYSKVTTLPNGSTIQDSDVDGFIYIKRGSEYFKRNYQRLTPEMFGAKGDAHDATPTTVAGTDDTQAFQSAINYLIKTGGGELYCTKSYLINGIVYINPTNQIPIFINGGVNEIKNKGSRITKSCFVKNVNGIFFSVNLNAAGQGVLSPSDQYTGFSINGVAFHGKKATEESGETLGIIGIKTFRTRGTYTNIYASRIDEVILQEDKDSLDNDSYNDQSIYHNIRISESTFGGLKLYRTDASFISGIYYEQPQVTAQFGIRIKYGTATVLQNVLHWCPTVGGATIPGGSFISLFVCYGTRIQGLHLERLKFETGIDLIGCVGTEVDGIHNRYSSNDMFKVQICRGLNIKNWFTTETKNAGTVDIRLVSRSDDNNQDINWSSCFFADNNLVERNIQVDGLNLINDYRVIAQATITPLARKRLIITPSDTSIKTIVSSIGIGQEVSLFVVDAGVPGVVILETGGNIIFPNGLSKIALRIGQNVKLRNLGTTFLLITPVEGLAAYGSGNPEGIVTALGGTIFYRTDLGTGGHKLFVKDDPELNNTGWKALEYTDDKKDSSNINHNFTLVTTDTNYSITGVNAGYQLNASLTANRTITLPDAVANSGEFLYIFNRNTTAFSWISNLAISNPDGTTFTAFNNNSTYILQSNGATWRLLSVITNSIRRVSVSDANYTVLSGDYLIGYVSLVSPRTITLPDPSTVSGKEFVIKDEVGKASTISLTVISAGTSKTIDGQPNKIIDVDYGSIRVYSNGVNYFLLSDNTAPSFSNTGFTI